MIKIIEIKSFLPQKKLNTFELYKKNHNRDFFKKKIGTLKVRRIKENKELVVNMCIKAFEKITIKDLKKIKVIVLCTQNPDYDGLPHNSAIIHHRLRMLNKEITNNVACFDVSLGCSGYVYCLKTIESFLDYGELGLIFTCDPYSRIIDSSDFHTNVLFGDASTATLVTKKKNKEKLNCEFHTYGEHFEDLIKKNKTLYMNGRNIFNFVSNKVPFLLKKFLKKNNLSIHQIKNFYFHQGSKFIIDTIANKMKLKQKKIPFFFNEIGNTVSSSIPLTLELSNFKKKKKPIILCGFGVGLSISIGLIM
jgi:3-oxoacyl-[acyl-carrier-protein] synthase-3